MAVSFVNIIASVLVLLVTCLAKSTFANQYDPHVYPSRGPFIEGWYARITDTSSPLSLGILFGRVLPVEPSEESSEAVPLTYMAILRSDSATAPFVVAEAYPSPDDISVTVDGGRPVTEDPDDESPANFRWAAEPHGFFSTTHNSTTFNFTIGEESLSGTFGPPVQWGPKGEGPEGWLKHLPFVPLHWFVYSLASVGHYTWENRKTGLHIHGNGTMHQEKNWGEGFPPSWIWMQGVNSTTSSAFAGTFGVLEFGGLSIPAHLFGFRDFETGLEANFRPDNSIAQVTTDGCSGKVGIEVVSFWYKLTLEAIAPASTLQRCLRGPTKYGFQEVLVESYVAAFDITVYKRGFLGYRMVDRKSFEGAALEFGGGQLCEKNPCFTEHTPSRFWKESNQILN